MNRRRFEVGVQVGVQEEVKASKLQRWKETGEFEEGPAPQRQAGDARARSSTWDDFVEEETRPVR